MGWIGNKFTWSNGHEDHTFSKERLDHGVANQRWMGRFLERRVEVLGIQVSDHKVLFQSVGGKVGGFQQRRNFKYEMSWGMEEKCSKIVRDECRKDNIERKPLKKIQNLLTGCRRALSRWYRGSIRAREGAIKEKIERLNLLEADEKPERMGEIKKLREELGFLLEQEDLRWKQRAKKQWLAYGDKNTQFFHACAS
ncbi:uncharacterized protein LOC118344867 [Juglans regia]|uniref:Uncharacterized protein LOC118344867 n=1 Tax=Juglans regia TaxID=51240 RepID=A0A6P9EI56_JUGRE|nr:uncharacterized protein LOC118344867 [Juglans regia]